MSKTEYSNFKQFVTRNRHRRWWKKLVRVMACVVVFCTTYSLILPAITLEKDVLCGYTEHTHDNSCYTKQTVTSMAQSVCTYEALSVHGHADDCKTADNALICGYADFIVHVHNDLCFDSAGVLTCCLPEIKAHTHNDGCYTVPATEAVHTHGVSCYTTQRGALLCQTEASEGHSHDETCYIRNELLCQTAETEGHTHIEGCSNQVLVCEIAEDSHEHADSCYQTTYICGLEEISAHSHSRECYSWTLICSLEEAEGHQHGDTCYEQVKTLTCELEEASSTVEVPVLICTQEIVELHSHSDNCWEVYTDETGTEHRTLICSRMEILEHTHSAECIETDADVLTCALTETEGHTHSTEAGCYDGVGELICQTAEAEPHTHGDMCYGTWALTCSETEHTHTDACYPAAYYCGSQEHTHGDACYDDEGNLTCEITEHIHSEDCTVDPNAVTYHCGFEEHSHGNACYDDEGNMTCEITEHTHSAECLAEPNASFYYCGREEHTHTEGCCSTEGNLICEQKAHTHIPACVELEGEALERVFAVIEAIDTMPSADEIDANVARFQEQGDEDGEVAYLEEVYPQVYLAYWKYKELGDNLQKYVVNADKLMELEYIWSGATYNYTSYTSKIYHINSYSTGATQQTSGTVMFVGSPVQKLEGQTFTWWKEVVVEWQDGYMRVAEIKSSGANASKVGHQASDTGFILLFHEGITQGFPYNVAVGDYVTPDFFIHQDGDVYSYNANGYGSVTFTKEPPNYTINSDPTTVLQYQENGGRVAHTSEFIDLNVYNYDYNVNNTWRSNQYYPGFQWPGGAYVNYDDGAVWPTTASSLNIGIPNYRISRQYVDSISFGDSIVRDHQYADSKTAFDSNSNGKFGKAVNATGVAKVYGTTAANSVGKINWLWYSGSWSDDSISNRPAGYSTTGKAIQFKMNDNTPITVDGISLEYLFPYKSAAGSTNENGVTKMNSQSVDGLFQVNPISGLYYYNSHNNHAQYSNNKFTLYDEIITPDFLLYPFGNFLPFNDINTEATQVGAFNNSGGMKTYVNGTIYDLQKWMADGRNQQGNPSDPFAGVYGYSSRYQLGVMLSEYAESWHNVDSGTTWNSLTSGAAVNDFFTGSKKPANSNASFSQDKLDNMYNIDWDKPTDFFFGMDMSMEFLMPKDGLTGHDNGNNTTGSWSVLSDGTFKRTGDPDGIPDYPLVFNFAGDDDVWAYIDGLLFLDLTGIHRHVGGTIDFQTGVVYYFGLDTAIGDTSNNSSNANYYYAETFEEIINRSFSSSETDKRDAMLAGLRPVLNADGTQRYLTGTDKAMKTFKDYTTHSFKFFYMERGSGSSVCRLNFNFPLLQKNSISVSKEVESDTQILGDPDYKFQVLKANTDGTKTNSLFIAANTSYTIYDVNNNNKLGTGTTDANGIFTIKPGQRAEFSGIAENSGKYYVRELLEGSVLEQYGNITVSGESTTISSSIVVGSDTFTGADSPVKDVADGGTFFRFTNIVDANKVGKLCISKKLVEQLQAEGKTFNIQVALDGKLLPIGTEYTVGDTTRTVKTVGIITIAADETATISNVLAGTVFEVQETTGSAEGYVVSYSDSGGYTIEVKDGKASGVIETEANVQLVVTNAEKNTSIELPGTKSLSNPDGSEHTYTFRLTEVTDSTGTTEKDGSLIDSTKSVTVTDTPQPFLFAISYASVDMAVGEQVFYYRIMEDAAENTLANSTYYVAEVTVIMDASGALSARITGIWKDGAKQESADFSADFTNTLTGKLSLSKTLVGAPAETEFTFTIQLEPNAEYPAVFYQQDKTETPVTLKTDENGEISLSGFKHGETAVISDIPYGTKWRITETNADGYKVTTTVSANEGTIDGNSTQTEGSIIVGDTVVSYTNTYMYELPDTGGAGTTLYTLGGCLLIMLSTGLLLYNNKKHRKEDRSPF